ncbi:P-loop NTPase [Candidatus Chloroploca sp. Khr17]|uniref:MinD/ParA family ATP-binding protein n=1 Tax=Candidatus Chloroploca sp. Khr17 TaxID=2496869 RepID=UPI00101C0B48|nr:P-loop NTPase [Candidatus Chloroploca sp. Khr17]
MVECVVFHSARAGIGKSTLAANTAALLARRGQRVGLLDANVQEGGLTSFFGLEVTAIGATLNDFLLERCEGKDAWYDVTPNWQLAPGSVMMHQTGSIWLMPASPRLRDRAALLQNGFRIERITDDLIAMAEALQLDTLLIDTHAGIQEESMLAIHSLAVAQTLVLVLQLDQPDYAGTAVAVDIAETLRVPQIVQVANQISTLFDPVRVSQELAQTYRHPVLALLPYHPELAALGSADLFVLRYPEHAITRVFAHVAEALLSHLDPFPAIEQPPG